jgi:hypothetical protein
MILITHFDYIRLTIHYQYRSYMLHSFRFAILHSYSFRESPTP